MAQNFAVMQKGEFAFFIIFKKSGTFYYSPRGALTFTNPECPEGSAQ